jgi:hypothetical protein
MVFILIKYDFICQLFSRLKGSSRRHLPDTGFFPADFVTRRDFKSGVTAAKNATLGLALKPVRQRREISMDNLF